MRTTISFEYETPEGLETALQQCKNASQQGYMFQDRRCAGDGWSAEVTHDRRAAEAASAPASDGRAEFEAWAIERRRTVDPAPDGEYRSAAVQLAWEAWQQARRGPEPQTLVRASLEDIAYWVDTLYEDTDHPGIRRIKPELQAHAGAIKAIGESASAVLKLLAPGPQPPGEAP